MIRPARERNVDLRKVSAVSSSPPLAMAAGSMMAGLLLQKKIFSSPQMICISGLIVGDRIMATFPWRDSRVTS